MTFDLAVSQGALERGSCGSLIRFLIRCFFHSRRRSYYLFFYYLFFYYLYMLAEGSKN